MSCDKKNRKEDAVKLAQAELDAAAAALAEVTKQEKDEEKKHADAEAEFIMFVVSSETLGLVSRCRIPIAAVRQRGLFRIILGSSALSITNITNKYQGIPDPPPGWIPPTEASYNTWPSVYTNLKSMDFCAAQFTTVLEQMRCVETLGSGPIIG